MNDSNPASNFAASMEGHYTTNLVSWVDYAIVIVSTIIVLVSIYYTIKFLLPGQRSKQPEIMTQVLEGEAGDR